MQTRAVTPEGDQVGRRKPIFIEVSHRSKGWGALPDGRASAPSNAVRLPHDTLIHADGWGALPDGRASAPSNAVRLPHDTLMHADGWGALPDGRASAPSVPAEAERQRCGR